MLSVRATALSFAHHLDVTVLPLVLCVFSSERNKSKTLVYCQCISGEYAKDNMFKISATLQITDCTYGWQTILYSLLVCAFSVSHKTCMIYCCKYEEWWQLKCQKSYTVTYFERILQLKRKGSTFTEVKNCRKWTPNPIQQNPITQINKGSCFSKKCTRVIITPAIVCWSLILQEHVFNWPFSNWRWLKQDAIGGKMIGRKEKQEFIKYISSFLSLSCTHSFNELFSWPAA